MPCLGIKCNVVCTWAATNKPLRPQFIRAMVSAMFRLWKILWLWNITAPPQCSLFQARRLTLHKIRISESSLTTIKFTTDNILPFYTFFTDDKEIEKLTWVSSIMIVIIMIVSMPRGANVLDVYNKFSNPRAMALGDAETGTRLRFRSVWNWWNLFFG